MKNNWPVKKLGEVIELKYGKGISVEDRKTDGKYPIYGANGELGRTDKFLVDGEAIIVGRKGSAGEVIRVSGKFWPSDVTYYVFGNKEIDVDYLFYLFNNINLKRFAKGIKPGINSNDVYNLEIPVPGIEEQKKIVKKLEKILLEISESRNLRQESLSDSQSIIFSTINKLFLESQKKGWGKLKIDGVSKVTSSKRVYEHEYVSQGVPFFRTKEISELANDKQIKTELFISKERFSELKNKFGAPKKDDILVTAIGTIGEIYIVDNDLDFYFKDGNVLWLKELKNINPKFLKLCLQFVIEKLKDASVGSAYKALSIEKLKQIEIPSPDLKEQKKIVAYLDGLSEKVQALQKLQEEQLQELEALQQSVLHKAFQGELLKMEKLQEKTTA